MAKTLYNGNHIKNIMDVATECNIKVSFYGVMYSPARDKEEYVIELSDGNKHTRTREVAYPLDCKHLYTEVIDDIYDYRRFLDIHYGNGFEW